ncbi:MAG TPA: hypothetical protein VJM10_08380 [Candidatus Methylomirabilis sp.]|nr:hypothetical protein [Candidatus Methylomirabilis sp.]
MPKKKNIRVNFTAVSPSGQAVLGQCSVDPDANPQIAGFEVGRVVAKALRKLKVPVSPEGTA